MSWIVAGSVLGWLGVAAAFGLFDSHDSSRDDDDGTGSGDGGGGGDSDVTGTVGDDSLVGNGGTVLGLAGNDLIGIFNGTAFAGEGDDTLEVSIQSVGYGDAGNDVIEVAANGGSGYGGDGDDRLTADGASTFANPPLPPGPATVFGDAGFDILAANGDASAYGGTGDDYLLGENSATLYGDEDDDVLVGGTFTNGITFATDMALFGGQGFDTLVGTVGDSLSGDDGKDLLVADAGNMTLTGGAGSDTFAIQAWQLTNGQSITITDFSAGDDLALLIDGSIPASNATSYELIPETVAGNAGFTVVGTSPDGGEALRMRIELSGLTTTEGIDFDIVPLDEETVFGLDSSLAVSIATLSDAIDIDDALSGTGTDTLFGGGGNDTITGASFGANDVLYGGDGDDTLSLASAVYGGAGADTLSGSGEAYGDGGDDVLTGSELYGGADDDLVTVRAGGGETLFSGSGYGGDGDDTITGFSVGGPGDTGADLYGGAGDDLILTNADSVVDAGAGADIVTVASQFINEPETFGRVALGAGADVLALAPARDDLPAEAPPDTYLPDVVSDFEPGVDQLAIVIAQDDLSDLTVTITSNVGAGYTDVVLTLPNPPDYPADAAGITLQSVRLTGVTDLDPADILLFADAAAVQAGTSYGALSAA